ncbi:DUF3311 domain-containing protein [Pseudonocardia sp.]|uniref:DUF3311 domain-containing protein n=1 Tax=Pseudonocardia sp. TaxID=60912 RepID=UPI0031FCCF8F
MAAPRERTASRRSLWWLLGPPVMFCGLLPLANRVDPVVLGMPFLMFWLLLATLLSPVFVRLAAKGDPVWAAARKREQGTQREREAR